MPWSSSDRAQRLPRDWATRRKAALKRDGYLCRKRGPRCTAVATEVDHVIPNDNHTLTNLQSLCSSCHRNKTQLEAVHGHAAVRSHGRRDAEEHPGATEGGG